MVAIFDARGISDLSVSDVRMYVSRLRASEKTGERKSELENE